MVDELRTAPADGSVDHPARVQMKQIELLVAPAGLPNLLKPLDGLALSNPFSRVLDDFPAAGMFSAANTPSLWMGERRTRSCQRVERGLSFEYFIGKTQYTEEGLSEESAGLQPGTAAAC